MIEQKLKKAENPDDPNRCQGTTKYGQCPFLSIEGTQYCKMHQGAGKYNGTTDAYLRNYRLVKWQSRINEFADNEHVKSLREEIGILRIVLEEILNKCKDADDLFIYAGKIADHVLKIEKMVVSCHRLEQSLGTLLDKTIVLQIADTIIGTIGKYINDGETLDKIGNEIIINIMSINRLNKNGQ